MPPVNATHSAVTKPSSWLVNRRVPAKILLVLLTNDPTSRSYRIGRTKLRAVRTPHPRGLVQCNANVRTERARPSTQPAAPTRDRPRRVSPDSTTPLIFLQSHSKAW